jgi:hypothetical protein
VDDTEEGITVKMTEECGPLSSKRPNTQKMLDSKSLLYGRFVKVRQQDKSDMILKPHNIGN